MRLSQCTNLGLSPKLLSITSLWPCRIPFQVRLLKIILLSSLLLTTVTNFYITCSRNCSSVYSAFCTLMVYFLWSKSSLLLICVILIVLYGALNIKPNKELSYLPVQSCHFFFLFSFIVFLKPTFLQNMPPQITFPNEFLSTWHHIS